MVNVNDASLYSSPYILDDLVPEVLNKKHQNEENLRNFIHAVAIGRPSIWGNPFMMRNESERDFVCDEFSNLVDTSPQFRDHIKRSLRFRKVVCFCKPKRCHGDKIIAVANEDDRPDNEIVREMIHLEKLITLHRLNYEDGVSAVADAQYDALYRRLAKMEAEFPEYAHPFSPTKVAGIYSVNELSKVKHNTRMISIETIHKHDLKGLRKYVERVKAAAAKIPNSDRFPLFTVEHKYDGIAANLVIRSGKLVDMTTRGDTHIGESLYHVALALGMRSDYPMFREVDLVEIRGELTISFAELKAINRVLTAAGVNPYKNPRNAVAGIVRRLSVDEEAVPAVEFNPYDLITSEEMSETLWPTNKDRIEFLKSLNISDVSKTQKPTLLTANEFDEIVSIHASIETERPELPYQIDGIVVKSNLLEVRRVLEKTVDMDRVDEQPSMVAYKFEPTMMTTRLKGIELGVSGLGKITVVGNLDPVDIDGVTVSRVNLFTEANVNRLGIGLSSLVYVVRSGDVTPMIVGRVSELASENTFSISHMLDGKCPSCSSELMKWKASSQDWYCSNQRDCPDQLVERIQRFCHKSAMNIPGVGELGAKALAQCGVAEVKDLYHLTLKQLIEDKVFSYSAAVRLLDAIEESKNRPLEKLLYGLSIPGVGKAAASALANHCGTLGEFIKISDERLEALLGNETARKIRLILTTNAGLFIHLNRFFK